VKNIRYGVFIFDTEGRFKFVNDAVVKKSGYPREWFVGKSLFELAGPRHSESVRKHFEASVRGEHVPPYEFAYRSATNELAWVSISTTAIREDNRIVGVLGLLLDITKRKKFERAFKESEEMYAALFQKCGEGVFVADAGGKLEKMNPSFLNLLGYSKEEAGGLTAADACANQEDYKALLKALKEQGSVEDYKVKLRKKDGSLVDCRLAGTAQRNYDGTLLRYQAIISPAA
jgi:PAS domain S-box-containing protein